MNNDSVNQLPSETIKLITSSQIVTSISTAVKELFENSIDAGGNIIQVRLENYGLDLVEVKDNGSGVSYENVQRMFLPGYTSKIKGFSDLESLSSYGFRGEALAAICKLGKVIITTKTNMDQMAMSYSINESGQPIPLKPSHLNKGTIVSVSDLFLNFPVRRLYMKSKKVMTDELKKTEHVIQSLSLIHPELNVSLIHNKCIVWRKTTVREIKQSFMQVVSLKTVSKMDHINKLINHVNVDIVIPKKNLIDVDDVLCNSVHNIYIYINKRPVVCKYLMQTAQEHIFHHYSRLNTTYKYATCLLSVNLPSQFIDVNLEPNKTKVLLKNKIEVIKILDEILLNYYNNENFHCSSLRETTLDESKINEFSKNEGDISLDDQQLKRLRLENSKCSCKENEVWNLKIIDETNVARQDNCNNYENNQNETSLNTESLCQQINRDNCTLATADEVSQLNALVSESNKLVTINYKHTAGVVVSKKNDENDQPKEKLTLPDWPSRIIPSVRATDAIFLNSTNSVNSAPNENNDKTANEIAKEIEKEIEKDIEQWSSDMIEAMKNDSSTEEKSSEKDEKEHSLNFDLSMESVSSQMGKKELKAFTKFARIMRPKITAEFPKLIFTQVASILVERWKALSADEIKYYEKMAGTVDLNRKIYREEKEKLKSDANSKCSAKKADNVNLLLDEIKKKNKLRRPSRIEFTVVTSINDIKERRTSFQHINDIKHSAKDNFQIIGQLRPSGNWLYARGNEIGHVRYHGLQEVIMYEKMLSEHTIPTKPLNEPILINEHNLGPILWNVFTSLESKHCEESIKFIVTSSVVAKNGFRVEYEKTNGVVSQARITEVASFIPQFGILDFKETLALYLKHGDKASLSNWRTKSVCSYLKNETIRLVQQSPQPDGIEIEEIMNAYNLRMQHLPRVCLHSKDIFATIYYMQW